VSAPGISPAAPPDAFVGASLGTDVLHLSLQRLVMVAGANRDFAPAHSDSEAARQGGAPAAFADVIFVFALFERLLMQWSGPRGRITRMGPLKIKDFLICGQDVSSTGTIESVRSVPGPDGVPWGEVMAKITLSQPDGREPVSGSATILVPRARGADT